MYLITAYFDNATSKQLQRLIDEISAMTGNDFMTGNHVPPHMTLCAFEQKSDDVAINLFEDLKNNLTETEIIIPSVGQFFPYVIYAQVCKNKTLLDMSLDIYSSISTINETRINHLYEPYDWIPHITLGKTLTEEQMRIAFSVLQEHFTPIKGQITAYGLSKPTPYRELIRIELSY